MAGHIIEPALHSQADTKPSAAFRCPNRGQALKLARAFELWGAESVEVADQEVAVVGSMRFLTILARLFSENWIEGIQTSQIDASQFTHLFAEPDPGESRG